jgi:hypothetical protein
VGISLLVITFLVNVRASERKKAQHGGRAFWFLPSISIISVCARFYDIDLSFRISNLGRCWLDMVVLSETAQSCPPIPLDLGGDRRYEPCHILLDFGSGPRRIGATAT